MHTVFFWPRDSCTLFFSSGQSYTLDFPGQGSHAHWVFFWSWESCTLGFFARESCTLDFSGQGSHAHWFFLAMRVMYSEVSWPQQSCTGRPNHAQLGILLYAVMSPLLFKDNFLPHRCIDISVLITIDRFYNTPHTHLFIVLQHNIT